MITAHKMFFGAIFECSMLREKKEIKLLLFKR